MNLNTWIPFESGCGDVVVFADPQDGWVGIEAWEDWVSDLRHCDGELQKVNMNQSGNYLDTYILYRTAVRELLIVQ